MTSEELRSSLLEAEKKGKIGLLVWANWTVWDNLAFDFKPGNQYYDFALSQIKKSKEATISCDWNGLSMPGLFAVSTQKLLSSDEFFTHFLNMCEEGHYEGPITLVPITEENDLS